MQVSILTLFPEMFQGPFDHSIVKKAQEKNLIKIEFINIRDFGIGKHKVVDDTPYGGGIGMILRPDVLYQAITYTKKHFPLPPGEDQGEGKPTNKNALKITQRVVLLTASGSTYNQTKAQEFSKLDHLILICGHYEGIDERIKPFIDEELSIGDFVLTGGEIPAMLITDSVTRLIPGVLKPGATDNESFSLTHVETQNFAPTALSGASPSQLLEYPHYTKPQEFQGQKVPEILLSGNHPEIEKWRLQQARQKTQTIRPDLLKTKNK